MYQPERENDKAIIVFDGYCNFCSGSVLFIIRRDPGKVFRFTASQEEAGQGILKEFGLDEVAEHSLILIRKSKIFFKSGAALRIAGRLRGLWPVFSVFLIIPRPFRDLFYDLIARNRYRFYTKREECFLPGEEIRDRFL